MIERFPSVRVGLSSDLTQSNGASYATVIPVDDQNEVVGATIEEQARQCFMNLDQTLRKTGKSLGDVVHLTIYLTDIAKDRQGFNNVYARVYEGAAVPVRCAVGVAALARPGFLVELTAIAG